MATGTLGKINIVAAVGGCMAEYFASMRPKDPAQIPVVVNALYLGTQKIASLPITADAAAAIKTDFWKAVLGSIFANDVRIARAPAWAVVAHLLILEERVKETSRVIPFADNPDRFHNIDFAVDAYAAVKALGYSKPSEVFESVRSDTALNRLLGGVESQAIIDLCGFSKSLEGGKRVGALSDSLKNYPGMIPQAWANYVRGIRAINAGSVEGVLTDISRSCPRALVERQLSSGRVFNPLSQAPVQNSYLLPPSMEGMLLELENISG